MKENILFLLLFVFLVIIFLSIPYSANKIYNNPNNNIRIIQGRTCHIIKNERVPYSTFDEKIVCDGGINER